MQGVRLARDTGAFLFHSSFWVLWGGKSVDSEFLQPVKMFTYLYMSFTLEVRSLS